eukprot:gnl/TRDRNA2_/TRDRNA2_144178_c0_seq1.p1 gnl/TRDRNA2_/TRDRNA2_144178_c0~~gnl/TRDRNA2_/TRDRNA2_144178_c0_seq1.p1  ORF type:complete len:310 (+),score=53.94 gnl/TRDRNA2_/TRDRNA2_144178_c0_seq1:70-930(+)
MEDFISEHGPTEIAPGREAHLVGIFDGHNGGHAAAFLRERLLPEVSKRLVSCGTEAETESPARQVFLDAFKVVESELLQGASETFSDGSTACVVAAIGGQSLLTGNCGDTRAVLVSAAERQPRRAAPEVVRLTVDHKIDGAEKARIEAAGGKCMNVKGCWRVVIGHLGLAVSRSFGDLKFKHGQKLPRGEALILCTPHVAVRALNPRDECVIIASDGLWDVVDDEHAAKVVRETLRGMGAMGEELAYVPWTIDRANKCAKALVDAAVALRTTDNISVMVLGLRWNN